MFCEMLDLGITVPSWQILRMSRGRLISEKDTCPEDIKKTLMRHAKNVDGHDGRRSAILGSSRKECGLNGSNPCCKERKTTDGTERHAAQARWSVTSGAWTQKRLHDIAKKDLEAAFNRRSVLRESLLEVWNVDKRQVLRIGEDRQAQVEAAEASYVSLYRLDDPCPC